MSTARILVVDDEEKVLNFIAEGLANEGYTVKRLNSAEKAINEAKDFGPDLILMDVVMPDIDGPEAAITLFSQPETRDIPIIFLTGTITEEEQQTGVNVGGVVYEMLAKPFKLDELLAKVKDIIKSRGY